MLLVIVGTGNHFLFDAFAGGLVVVAAWLIAGRLALPARRAPLRLVTPSTTWNPNPRPTRKQPDPHWTKGPEAMSPLKHSNNLAARMGRWSAGHWKTAVFGWLALVAASVYIGGQVGTKYLEDTDLAVGEAGKAAQLVEAGFPKAADEQGEIVLIQSKTLKADDPAFKATDRGRRRRRSRRTRRSASSTRRTTPATPTSSRPTATRRR